MSTEGPDLPSSFGRYTLVSRLAMGGMAEVFKAKISASHGFEKILVIKRILPHLAADKNFVSMFIDEAKLTAQLTHPKIVQVTDFGEVAGQFFIALEFIDGFDALALLRTCAHRRLRLPFHLGVFVVQEMLDALDYAHNAVDSEGRPMKLVHRDISPSNVFISRRGDVKLGDFGIAHATERESKTQAGTLKGKYGYMSPEQVMGNPLDGRSDVFAVGIVLAEMLMGRRLFTAPNDLDVLLMVRDGKLERYDKYSKDIPPALDAIVRKSLARDLADRYASAAEFRDALAEWLFAVGRRVAPADLGAYAKDLFDESPEALKRLQDLQAKLKAESAAPPRAAAAAPIAAPPPEPAAPKIARAPAPAAIDDAADILTDDAELDIPLDVNDLQPMTTHARPAAAAAAPAAAPAPRPTARQEAEPDPNMTRAFEDAFARGLNVVDIDTWGVGGDPAPSGGGVGLGPPFETPAPVVVVPDPGASPAGRFQSAAPNRAPDASGDLAQISTMRLFADMAASGETGLIQFHNGTDVKEIFVARGIPQSINSSNPAERFGEYLVAGRSITAEQLQAALQALPRFSGKLGDTLVGLGYMKPLDVFRLLSQQVRERVMDVFGWPAGQFAYFRGVTNPNEAFTLNLDTFEILGAGVLALTPQFLDAKLAPQAERRPRAMPHPRITPEQFRLGPTPREVLNILDGNRTLRQWMGQFPTPDERLTFLRTLYLLIETSLVQMT